MAARTRRSEPDRTPREDRVATEPATVERCAEDYAAGAATRASIERAWARARRGRR